MYFFKLFWNKFTIIFVVFFNFFLFLDYPNLKNNLPPQKNLIYFHISSSNLKSLIYFKKFKKKKFRRRFDVGRRSTSKDVDRRRSTSKKVAFLMLSIVIFKWNKLNLNLNFKKK